MAALRSLSVLLQGWRLLCLACLLGWQGLALGAPGLLEPINRASPSETYQSFLAAAHRLEEDYTQYLHDLDPQRIVTLRRELARMRLLFDLSEVPPASRAKVGNAAIGYLYDVLSRLPPVAPDSLPGHDAASLADMPARWSIPGTDIQLQRMTEGPQAGDYLISAESVKNLPEYYESVRKLPVLADRRYPDFHIEQINVAGPWIPAKWVSTLPQSLRKPYLSTPLWKILAVAAVALLGTLVFLLWARFAWARSRGHTELSLLGWRLSIPLALLLISTVCEWLVRAQVNPSGIFAASENLLASAIYHLGVAGTAWYGVYFLFELVIRSPRIPANSYDAHLLRLSARVLSIFAVATTLVLGANDIGIPAVGVLAGLGVGGVALALASQATIENLISGVSLFADRPFRVGDWIEFDDSAARVERVGPRSTRLRMRAGTLCTVPNTDLLKMHITNLSERSNCYLDQVLPLHGDSPADAVELLMASLREFLLQEPLVEQDRGWPRIHVVAMQPGRIDLRLSATVLTPDNAQFLAFQSRLILLARQRMDELGLRLAVPLPTAAQG
ncbi:mechanosensitive ion channel family protein [Bordetella trematum]|uniref:mechanosensitive ion channel family protein n=1 Tax=Bordetella trematum TaxID=123899 RepID=UPI000471222F|nr:mechanosensitive ion channel domain-containing protein [Bordetella trematum]